MKKKRRLLLKGFLFFCAFTLLVCPASALSDNVTDKGAEIQSDAVYDENSDALEKAEELLSDNNFSVLWNKFTDGLKSSFFAFSKRFYTLIFITLMLGIINVMCGTSVATYAGEICLCSFSFSLVAAVCENITEVMNSLNTFILSMLPVMTSLYTTSVGVSTATISHSSTLILLSVCSTLFSALLLPAVKSIIVFSCVTLISRSFDFSGFAKGIKSIVGWLFGAVMCIMSAVIFFQSVISVSKDGLASRTVRYAAQSLIPIIGSVVSESARTVSESLKLVRGVTGVAGIFAIIGIILTPVAALLVNKLFIALCGSLSRLLGCVKVSAYYNEIGAALNLLLGACIGVSIVFILILGIFAKASIQI